MREGGAERNFGTLWALAALVSPLSLIAFGGINTVLPAIHHQAVDVAQWMNDRDFANLYAIAQAAPGPNVLVATLALCLPTSVLAYFVVRVWDRFRDAHWRKAIQAGLVPVTAITAFIAYRTRISPL